MKKPKNRAERALVLGKANQCCETITEIFEILDIESQDINEGISLIQFEIDKHISELAKRGMVIDMSGERA